MPSTDSSQEWLSTDLLAPLNELKLALLEEGRELLDLGMINPDLPPPRILMDKLLEASVKPANHRYAVSRGVRRLREAFALRYGARFGVALDPESEICVTMGTKDAISSTLRTFGHPGDTVLLGAPAYPAHVAAVRLAGMVPAFYPTAGNEAEVLAAVGEQVARSRPRILLLNYPANPTGRLASRRFIAGIGAIAREFDLLVVNDFVYGDLVHDRTAAASFLAEPGLSGRVLEVMSLSKAWSIPGWRIGALAGSSELVRPVSRFKSHHDYGVFLPLQLAAAAALSASPGEPGPLAGVYQARAGILCDGLARLGWEVVRPAAGASVWAKPPRGAVGGSVQFARELLQTHGIMVMPGAVFGAQFDDCVRFALVAPEQTLRSVLERLA